MPSFPFFRLPFYQSYYNYNNNAYNNYYKHSNQYDKNYYSYNSNSSFTVNKTNNKKHRDYNTDYNTDYNIDYKKFNKQNKENKIPPKYSSSPFDFINNVLNGNKNDPIFEIFSIELYLDDIIILGLLFILYKEGVQDEMLFLALILLLLT